MLLVSAKIVLAPFWATMTNTQMCPGIFLGDNDKEPGAMSDACIIAAAVPRKAQYAL